MNTPLPEGYTARPPGWDDFDAVYEFMRLCEEADEGEAEVTLDDLRGDWQGIDLARDAWLVLGPGGGIAGWASVSRREGSPIVTASGYTHPRHTGRGIGRWLVRAVEARTAQVAAEEGRPLSVHNIVIATNDAARRLLEAEGYHPERWYWRMVIDLDSPPPEAQWPAGVTPRRFGEGDEREVYELIVAAFESNGNYTRPSFEEWRGFMMERESFDPELWFLAEADGRIVGAALCPDYEAGGWVRQVGVAGDWRRKGVAGALLHEAFRELHRRGKRSAGLVVDSYNTSGAKRVYERAGMREERTHIAYAKEIAPGT